MRAFLIALVVCVTPAFAEDCPVPYDYCGVWTGACATGRLQSPIVTYKEQRVQDNDLPKPGFYYAGSTRVTVKNDGTALKITPVKTWLELHYGTEVASLVGFHFHVGAEHKPDVWNDPDTGIAVAELHLVHKTPGGRQIVVAVPVRVGASNAFLSALRAMKPFASCEPKTSTEELPMGALLPADTGRYMTYTGSLTTPPCDPNVTWILMNSGITATQEEINDVKVLCSNARPVQVNKETVKFRDVD
jgi:carbonic anhydrase